MRNPKRTKKVENEELRIENCPGAAANSQFSILKSQFIRLR